MNKKETTPRERIPYKEWANSQLSVAKYYGGITINGTQYVLDYDNCPTTGEGDAMKYFPDLVLFSLKPKSKKKKTSLVDPNRQETLLSSITK